MIDLRAMLSGVRETRDGEFMAFCPSHEDKRSPSLTVKDTGDRWLVHCFAGCSVLEVCGALGIEMRQLFHDSQNRRDDGVYRIRPQDALDALEHEAQVLYFIALDMQSHGRPHPDNVARLGDCVRRIGDARRYRTR